MRYLVSALVACFGSLLLVAVFEPAVAATVTVDFEDEELELPPDSYYNGSDQAGGFTSRGVFFPNDYDTLFGIWAGWSYSNMTDTTTPGFGNQYSAYTGEGAAGSATYAVGFQSEFTAVYPLIPIPEHFAPQSLSITNTTYAALSMLLGDAFAKQFGGETGDDPDWFLLSIIGLDAALEPIGTVEFYLADYRFTDPADDYVLDEWTVVDVSLLAEARTLKFALSSSDVGPFGMNTPAYFALDNLLLACSLPGDVDDDGEVDFQDFLVLQAGYGATTGAERSDGDLDDDNDVDFQDFLVLQAHYGDMCDTLAAATSASAASVPEPASWLMCLVGAAALAIRAFARRAASKPSRRI